MSPHYISYSHQSISLAKHAKHLAWVSLGGTNIMAGHLQTSATQSAAHNML